MNKTGFTLLHNRGGGAAGPGAEALLQVAGGGPGREAGLGARVRDAVAAEGAGHAAALGARRGDAFAPSAGRRRTLFRAFVLLRRAVTALLPRLTSDYVLLVATFSSPPPEISAHRPADLLVRNRYSYSDEGVNKPVAAWLDRPGERLPGLPRFGNPAYASGL